MRYELTNIALKRTSAGVATAEVVPGASVLVKDLRGQNLPVYAAETGATALSNPLTTDTEGRVEGWVDAPDCDLVFSGNVATYTEKVRRSDRRNVRSFGAAGDASTTDATAQIQAAIYAAVSDGGGQVFIPAGRYGISAPLVFPGLVGLSGPSMNSGGAAVLYHNFAGPMMLLQESATLENLYLQQNGAFEGAAIQHVTPDATSRGFFQFNRIVVSDSVSDRGWHHDVFIDGTLGSIGVRSLFFNDCQFFGALTPGETVVLKKAVHCHFRNCEVVQAPQTTVVCGVKVLNTFSEDVYFGGCTVDGTFISDAVSLVFDGRIRQGRTITCQAGSDNNVFMGDVMRATFTNQGGAGNRRV